MFIIGIRDTSRLPKTAAISKSQVPKLQFCCGGLGVAQPTGGLGWTLSAGWSLAVGDLLRQVLVLPSVMKTKNPQCFNAILCNPWGSKDHSIKGLLEKTIILVGIYNQQFQWTIFLMVFDFQGNQFLSSVPFFAGWSIKIWCSVLFSMFIVSLQNISNMQCLNRFITGLWFQIFFIFTPIWGRFPIWLIFFKGVETQSYSVHCRTWSKCYVISWIREVWNWIPRPYIVGVEGQRAFGEYQNVRCVCVCVCFFNEWMLVQWYNEFKWIEFVFG